MEEVHIAVYGMVQGVGFRASVVATARRLGLVGWVRNLSDGSVAIMAQGPRASLDELVSWCRQGTSWAHVERVEHHHKEPSGSYDTFRILY